MTLLDQFKTELALNHDSLYDFIKDKMLICQDKNGNLKLNAPALIENQKKLEEIWVAFKKAKDLYNPDRHYGDIPPCEEVPSKA
jgi:hypothetical protein